MNLTRSISLLALLTSISAPADWSANMVTRYGPNAKETKEVSGKIFVRGSKVRLDVTTPTDMSIIYDQTEKTSSALVHTAKIRLDGGFEEYQDRVPLCLPGQFDACFKRLNLKKVRSETIDGQACDVYEGKGTRKQNGENFDLTLWRPVQWKEVMALKTIVQVKGGDRYETVFKEVALKPIAEKEFAIPKSYVRAGGLEKLLKSLKGFSNDTNDTNE